MKAIRKKAAQTRFPGMLLARDYKADAKRLAKYARNLFKDPLPRNNVLTLARIAAEGARVEFHYRALEVDYLITMDLPAHLEPAFRSSAGPALNQLLTLTGIALSVFLFKLSDFATLDVRTAPLDSESRHFFERFLMKGLGEFRYRQALDPGKPIAVRADAGGRIEPLTFDTENRVLMMNGGGKDTIVAAEMLKQSGQPFTWVTIEPNQTRRQVIELSGVPDSIEVSYEVDEKIATNQAYPWGHVPRTSIVLSIGLLIAVLTKARFVAVGNELSANYGNLLHRGMEVNHQYSKSFAFEKGFWSFARRRVTHSVEVFSILRPFHDLQLAQLFVGQKRYLKAFISCNRGIARGRWCKECAKCAFTALALSPFATAQEIDDIFGEDVLQRIAIRKHILDLVTATIKPWECVGTRDECLLGLALLLERSPRLDFAAYPTRKDLERALDGVDTAALRHRILESTGREHMIPDALRRTLNTGLSQMSADRLRIDASDDAVEEIVVPRTGPSALSDLDSRSKAARGPSGT